VGGRRGRLADGAAARGRGPPLEEPSLLPAAEGDARLRWLAQFVRDAPYLVHGGWRVGVETAPVRPFPHQRMVAYDVLDRFPCRRLLADEVGLGKTVEAGFVLRSLLLSGWVSRCLILVPRSLARQWQEELRERFGIEAPFYDGSRFVRFGYPHDRYQDVPEEGPWQVHPVVIASAQMVRRPERARTLLEAPPWDLVIVDEAHHARRRDFLDLERHRPNRLLQLLERLRERTRGLLLLTATPMQVHPVEAWDLLRLLGMPGRWQDDQRAFLAYFQELHKASPEEMDWGTLLPLFREAVEEWGWDRRWEREAKEEIGPVGVQRIKGLVMSGSARAVHTLTAREKHWLLKALRRHSPVGRLMYRHTRSLLREYHRRGLVGEHVPERRPEPVWLEMTPEERGLYEQTERYVSEYYQRYEKAKKGLGFVMRVYRQRLTSSLYALRKSLERRREFLLGRWQDEERPLGLEEEDIEEADLDEDVLEELQRPAQWQEELRELEALLAKLKDVTEETKPNALERRLQELLKRFDQVLVFTQYTDTLEFLRERLRPAFGARLGCYSGRGGEVWESRAGRWATVSKAEVQQRFERGDLKVLVCTEAAGEGLNLQNCGAIINYDMPWNPMKVEQRIGRIDRLGQRRPEVVVLHFFYEGTVEARVYEALSRRIGWFETVVGELQPILRRAYLAIQRAAMEPPEGRDTVLAAELEAVAAERPLPELEGWHGHLEAAGPGAPLTSEDVAALFPAHGVAADEGAQRCDPYGQGVLPRLAELPPPPARPGLVRLERVEKGMRRVGYYRFRGGSWVAVPTIRDLKDALEEPPPGSPVDVSPAHRQFEMDLGRAASGK
jgi:superfamily II DNA or RNA helicase